MWTLNYSQEAKLYFVDNEPYTFEVLVRIEELKFDPEAIPPEGLTPLDDSDERNLYLWLVLNHVVFLRREASHKQVYIVAVRPLEV
jgi:hypothetical protein